MQRKCLTTPCKGRSKDTFNWLISIFARAPDGEAVIFPYKTFALVVTSDRLTCDRVKR
jgi:hypothetical protein